MKWKVNTIEHYLENENGLVIAKIDSQVSVRIYKERVGLELPSGYCNILSDKDVWVTLGPVKDIPSSKLLCETMLKLLEGKV